MVEGKGFHSEDCASSRILDEKRLSNNGKLGLHDPAAQPPKQLRCPECGSKRLYKDGLRYTKQGEVQRYLCRSCGYRFSEPKVKVNVSTQSLKTLNPEPNFFDTDVTKRNFPIKERHDSLSFQRREDVVSEAKRLLDNAKTELRSITAKMLLQEFLGVNHR